MGETLTDQRVQQLDRLHRGSINRQVPAAALAFPGIDPDESCVGEGGQSLGFDSNRRDRRAGTNFNNRHSGIPMGRKPLFVAVQLFPAVIRNPLIILEHQDVRPRDGVTTGTTWQWWDRSKLIHFDMNLGVLT